MAKPRTKDDPGPVSVRLPPAMRAELDQWAAADMRSLHSLLLVILRDALAARRRSQPGAENAASGDPPPPMP